MILDWKDRYQAKGDLGIYSIKMVQSGEYVGEWTPFNEKGYRANSLPRVSIEECQSMCQVMEDDMTGCTIMNDERWQALLDHSPDLLEVYR